MADLSALLDPNFSLNLVHFIGAIIAVGAVLATDAINSYLHLNPEFAEYDAKIAPIFSLIIWIGFLILSVTGLLMFLRQPALIHDTVFRIKMLFVAVIFLNGVFLNVWVTPKFQELSDEWSDRTQEVKSFEKLAGLTAVISVVGWITVLVLGYLIANT